MEYSYFWGLLFVLPFTIFAYIKSTKDVRIKMIISGIGFGILSIIFADDVFFTYWAPIYNLKRMHEIFKKYNISLEEFDGVNKRSYNKDKDNILVLKK